MASSQTIFRSSAEITLAPDKTAPGWASMTSDKGGRSAAPPLSPPEDKGTGQPKPRRRAAPRSGPQLVPAACLRDRPIDRGWRRPSAVRRWSIPVSKAAGLRPLDRSACFENARAAPRTCGAASSRRSIRRLHILRRDHAGDAVDAHQVLAVDQRLEFRQERPRLGEGLGFGGAVQTQDHGREPQVETRPSPPAATGSPGCPPTACCENRRPTAETPRPHRAPP